MCDEETGRLGLDQPGNLSGTFGVSRVSQEAGGCEHCDSSSLVGVRINNCLSPRQYRGSFGAW